MSTQNSEEIIQKSETHAPTGHIYIQSNEVTNELLHYGRRADGNLDLIARHQTGGAGSGVFKPVSGQESAPNAFEGAGSVILTPDRKFLFATNGGDNSVSSFSVDQAGDLTLVDVQKTGEPIDGRSGTAKSLAYSPSSHTLYVLHAFGPNHLRAYSVNAGKLSLRDGKWSVNTSAKTDRIPTQVVLSPDGKFLLVDILFDARPATNPDGSANLLPANVVDHDGLVVFPVNGDGDLGLPRFEDAGGIGPFFLVFLNKRRDTFLNGHAVSDGVSVGHIDHDGKITHSPVVQIDADAGKPSELCWLYPTSDDSLVFAANFGLSYVSSFTLDGDTLRLAKDPACPQISGDGTFRAVNGLISSGPNDSWMTPDDRHYYQIYPNASLLLGYGVNRDGSLTEVCRVPIPYNSPQGLAGF